MAGDCLFLFLTEGCDLACLHCYVSASPLRVRQMSRETVVQAPDLAGDLGITDVRLTGGEPTHHSDFVEIAEIVLGRGCSFGFTTNGKRLLRDPVLEGLTARASRCWISAYGPTDARHREIGGKAAVPLEALIEWVGGHAAGDIVGLSVLLTTGFCREVEALLDRLANAGVRRVRFIPVQPDGRATHLDRFQWSGWVDEVRELHLSLLEKQGRSDFTHLSLNNPFDLEREFGTPAESCLLRRRAMWSVVPDGRVYPCCYTVYEASQEVGRLGDATLILLCHSTDGFNRAAFCFR